MKSSFWKIIPPTFRRRAIWVALTIFVRALLNFVGLAMLVPILILILDSENIASNSYLSDIYNTLSFNSYEQFVVVVCLAVVGIIILKNVLVLLLYRSERNFIYSLYKYLSERLYIDYHHRGLGFVKRSNSAILTRNVNVVSLMFVAGVLKPVASIASEVLLLLLIYGSLLWYSPLAALLALAVFIPAIALFYVVVRRKLSDIGKRENEAQRTKSRIVAETFRGYADVEISGAFPQMFKRFEEAMNETVSLRKKNATIGMLPQMFTEVGLAVGMTTLLFICISGNMENMRLLFGIFAVAALRLIPSIRSIMSGWSAIRYNAYSVDILAESGTDESYPAVEQCDERFTFSDTIELRDLCFQFDDATTPTFNSLSLNIHKGECVGIRGTSGVGKTTLFNLILGLYRPTAGGIYIDGEKLTDKNIRKWQNSIGYVSQNVFIADMTLAENIALGCDADTIDLDRVQRVIELADLREFVASLPDGLNSRIGEQGSRLSGGQRQRIGIARALYKSADVLFFDEATSSLDGRTEENINTAIKRLSEEDKTLTIVIIAHRESSLEYCNRVITLE
ncbi:MAG: ABC transporter ATP-binding protein [Alistipes sp.]|nr:ABC transporter ATP-binding protein [Alistipes sp.]